LVVRAALESAHLHALVVAVLQKLATWPLQVTADKSLLLLHILRAEVSCRETLHGLGH
jgi:hypothetical protein